MMTSQKHLFHLTDEVVYLNGAYWSPQLKAVEKAGIEAVRRKNRPYEVGVDDFFRDREKLCSLFSQLIAAGDPQRIAIIPSVSYGLANVIRNVNLRPGSEVLLLEEQFPSNYYGWKRISEETGAKIVIAHPPDSFKARGAHWNQILLEAINPQTAVVAIPQIHWADGTYFDLGEVRTRCDEVGALLILDGTQSIGAFPFSVEAIRPDAVICGGYKWLMGPYSLGLAYYGEHFDHGTPIEDNWINRLNSREFSLLTKYQENFEPKAARYGVGESSNFILVPMLIKALEQLLEWGPANVQAYCSELVTNPIAEIRQKGHWVEEADWRASHLFGIYLQDQDKLGDIKAKLLQNNIHVSYRGKAIRISPNVYNTPADLNALLNCL